MTIGTTTNPNAPLFDLVVYKVKVNKLGYFSKRVIFSHPIFYAKVVK
jgi:hypothetical protein